MGGRGGRLVWLYGSSIHCRMVSLGSCVTGSQKTSCLLLRLLLGSSSPAAASPCARVEQQGQPFVFSLCCLFVLTHGHGTASVARLFGRKCHRHEESMTTRCQPQALTTATQQYSVSNSSVQCTTAKATMFWHVSASHKTYSVNNVANSRSKELLI